MGGLRPAAWRDSAAMGGDALHAAPETSALWTEQRPSFEDWATEKQQGASGGGPSHLGEFSECQMFWKKASASTGNVFANATDFEGNILLFHAANREQEENCFPEAYQQPLVIDCRAREETASWTLNGCGFLVFQPGAIDTSTN